MDQLVSDGSDITAGKMLALLELANLPLPHNVASLKARPGERSWRAWS